MRRHLWIFTFVLGVLIGCAGAEAAKIGAVSGEVLARSGAEGVWVPVVVGQDVSADTEIQTRAGSQCVVIFDDAKKVLATIKENSKTRVESLTPGSLFLLEGRVFSLIKAGAVSSNFVVKTPTAIAGARGTAWESDFIDGKASFACFDSVIYVSGVNEAGQAVEERELSFGQGIEVAGDGEVREPFELPQERMVQGQLDRAALDVLSAGAELPGVSTTPVDNQPSTTAAGTAGSLQTQESKTGRGQGEAMAGGPVFSGTDATMALSGNNAGDPGAHSREASVDGAGRDATIASDASGWSPDSGAAAERAVDSNDAMDAMTGPDATDWNSDSTFAGGGLDLDDPMIGDLSGGLSENNDLYQDLSDQTQSTITDQQQVQDATNQPAPDSDGSQSGGDDGTIITCP